jgi:hypothetical protein
LDSSVKFQNKISEHGAENKIIKAQNFLLQKPQIKTMFIISNEKQCVIHRESVPEGKTKKSEFYARVLETLSMWTLKAKPQFKEKVALHGSVHAHSTKTVKHFQANCSKTTVRKLPLSPDCDSKYFLFSKMKTATKGTRVQNVTNMKENAIADSNTANLNACNDHLCNF